MTMIAMIKKDIVLEREQRQAISEYDVLTNIRKGKGRSALEQLLFYTSPERFGGFVHAILRELRTEFDQTDEQIQGSCLQFLTDLVLALNSVLPLWNLQNYTFHGDTIIDSSEIDALAEQTHILILQLAELTPQVADSLLIRWREETAKRFTAEGVENAHQYAERFVGISIEEYISNRSIELKESNIRRIAEMQMIGDTLTEFSNDYATFLEHAMYLGASFATTNPPLVDYAWQAFPERWNPIVDRIISDNPEATTGELATQVTLEIVLANMYLLRPIFLLTDGGKGCVCLQVNPHNYNDADAMISEGLSLYEELQTKLEGGVPNVVFKLPGTQAGLEACKALTGQGIGVTITVNFGMFQHIPFTEAISKGQAIYSNLVEMNGRLAYPVRDELLEKLEELSTHGIDETKVREASAWAGVAVIKRVYSLLNEKGYDLRRIKPLVASMRIYDGDGYGNLPSVLPDITETIGASIISVFPDIRRSFDQQSESILDPMRIEVPVSDDILTVLAHSEIFRQAYFIADREWLTEEDGRFKPDHELKLGDEDAVAAWAPVYNTLTSFQDSYDKFVQRILDRKRSETKSDSGEQ